MLPRHAADPKDQKDPGDERDRGKLQEEIAAGGDGGASPSLDFQSDLENVHGLSLVERFFTPGDLVDELFSRRKGIAGTGENMEVGGGVHHAGDDEGQHDGRRDEEKLLVEAHSYN
jgi:hypothetical protein